MAAPHAIRLGKPGSAIATVIASTVEFGSRRTLIVFGIMLASLLGRIDGTIVNVALPTIQGNLGASYDEVTWIIIGYLMANVVVIPMTPWLAMRFGRRNAFIAAIVGFTLMSLLCATSTSISELVIFRVLQGAFAGGIDSTANTVLSSTFPPAKLGLAQSIYSLSAAAAPPIGLILGGLLTDNLSWQWCFLINVPLGSAAAIILFFMLRNPATHATAARPPFDTVGVALLAVGPSLLVYGLSEGDRFDWFNDPSIVMAFVFGVLTTAAFALWELKGTRTPIVDLRIFRFRRVVVGATLWLGTAFIYLSSMVFLPQFAQEILGYTPTQSGVLVLMRSIPTALLTPVAASLASSGRINIRWLIASGYAVLAVATYWQSQMMTPGTDFNALLAPLMIAGIGNAFTFSPLFVAMLGGVPGTERPKAAAIASVTIQLGGALATSVLISSLHVRSSFHQSVLAANATLAHSGVAEFIHRVGAPALNAMLEMQARSFAYADVAFVIACVAAIMIPVAFFLGKPQTT